MATDACVALIRQAAPNLSRREIEEIDDIVTKRGEALKAAGQIDGLDQRIRKAAIDEGEKAKLAAALQRKHAMLNAIVRDKLDRQIKAYLDAGLSRQDAILGILEGTVRTPNGKAIGNRVSVNAEKMAYERKFVGGMVGEINRLDPAMLALIDDENFNYNIVREWGEIRESGNPGSTGDKEAQAVARIFAKYAENSRQILNGLGANIGKLDGWVGPQVEDHFKLQNAGQQAWVDSILPRLNLERSFPDATIDQVRDILDEVYITKVTGRDRSITGRQKGEYSGPANLAKSLGKHRVLHFRDAEAWIEHHKQFGHGTAFTSMMEHQRRSAQIAGAMSVLGPNPETMVRSIMATQERAARLDGAISPEDRAREIEAIKGHAIETAIAELTNKTSIPTSAVGARVTNDIRALESMSKLGGVLISSLGGDLVTSASNLRYQGRSFWASIAQMIRETARGRSSEDANEINFLTGEGFDGIVSAIVSQYDTNDGPVGALSKLTHAFFKWTGVTWWTDVARAANARIMMAGLGRHSSKQWADLPEAYTHMLGQHGIGEREWGVIKEARFIAGNGNTYIDPNRIQSIPDGTIETYVKAEADAIRSAKNGTPEAIERGLAKLFDRTKLDLELSVRRMIADETDFAMLRPDAVTRRYLLQGTRPGSPMGVAARLVTQFKAYPAAFTHRVLGRGIYGQMGETKGQRILNSSKHLGILLAGLWVSGYAAKTAKEMLRGNTPQDPTKPATIMAALLQSGGMGIYGDFLFAQSNRFGGGALETAAGPALGSAGDAFGLLLRARDGDARAADFLSFGLQNVPYINLFYTRAALDYAVINSMKEGLSPGYLARQEARRYKDFGQERLFEAEMFPDMFR